MLMSFISGSVTWDGSTGIRVGSTHPGEEDAWHAWGASARVGRRPAGEWWRVRPCPTSDFDAVFTSGFVSASSRQWYGQNTSLTTFIFEQKSNTPLNHVLWYQLLGKSDRRCTDNCSREGKAHWHNILRGSANPPTSTGEVHFIRYRDTWKKITSAAMAARLLPLQLSLFSLFSRSLSQPSLHSPFALK